MHGHEDVPGEPGGARPAAPAAGRDRPGGGRLHGRRHPHGRALPAAAPALRLVPPAVRPGDQPAHRPAARGGGHVLGDHHRPGAAVDLRRIRAAREPGDPHLAGAVHGKIPGPHPPGPLGLPGAPLAARLRPGADRPARGHRNPLPRGRGRGPRRRGAAAPLRPGLRPARAAGARPAGGGRGPPPPLPRGAALQRQPDRGHGHGPRPAPGGLPDRLRRHRRLPVPGLRRARRPVPGGRPGPARGQGPEELPPGHQEGPVENPQQDGHRHRGLVPRGAAVRDHRPGRGGGGGLLPGHAEPHRRGHLCRPGGGPAGPCPRGHPAAAADPAGRPAQVRARPGVPRLQPGGGARPAGRGGQRRLLPMAGLRRTDQQPAAGHPARPAPPASGHPADSARPGRARGCDPPPLRHRRHVLGRAFARGARGPGRGHEQPGRPLEQRRGRRGPGPLRYRADVEDQADRLGPVRRHPGLPGQRRGAADQDRPGRQAGRGRPAAGQQGERTDRPAALRRARRDPDLAAAAPRHLLHRGPGPAHLRPQAGEPGGAGVGQAGVAAGHRHHCRGRGQGLCRPDHGERLRRRHRRQPDLVHPPRRFALGAGVGRGAPDPAGQRPARQDPPADRRRPQDRAGRGQGGHARRRELRLRHRAHGGARLQVPAHLPPEQLRHRHRHPARGSAPGPLPGHGGAGGPLLPPARRRDPGMAGRARRAHAGGTGRPGRPARTGHRHHPPAGAARSASAPPHGPAAGRQAPPLLDRP